MLGRILHLGASKPADLAQRPRAGGARGAGDESPLTPAELERFRALMLPHLDAAYGYARFLCRDATLAEDLVQDAYLRACRAFRSYRGGEPKAWLFAVLWLVLALVLAAFAEEIFWAGILSIPKGQWEAARSTGLSFLAALGYVVLPQAVRLTVPPLTNRTIAITKNTALGTVIGVGEILNQATTAQSFSANATPLMMGAIAYLILFIPVVVIGRFLETRFAWRRA